jgi:alkylation response protein AidB-like acyl-CoA dehydrogenase
VFTTNTEDAAVFLVYCRFAPGIDGIGSVLVERGMDGFRLGQPSHYMNGETWCALYFDNVFIPPENVLLKEGGFRKQIAGFNVERVGNATRALALGEYCFRQAKAHAETRRQFGRVLAEFQGLQWKFAEARVALDGAQLLLYRAASRGEKGLPTAQDVAIAKYACNQAGWMAANEAMQIMGGAGYSQDLLIEYCVRKTRGWMIAGGSLEMMKNRIAEGVFSRSFPQRPRNPAR